MRKLLPVILLLLACNKKKTYPLQPAPEGFRKVPESYLVFPAIKEASGIADSKVNEDHLWVEQDSGNPARLYMLKHNGILTDSVSIEGATNRDWEDIAVAKGPDDALSYVYIADIGDNNRTYSSYMIYRLPEPNFTANSVSEFDKIEFTYPDGSHDAEAFLVDDSTKDIYIFLKTAGGTPVYKLRYPQNTGAMNQAELVTTVDIPGIVSATLSSTGAEMIIKTYGNLYYYKRTPKEGVETTLTKIPESLAYSIEPQGEAVCFANNNSGFFTLSEEAMDVIAELKFYRRGQ
jgi:hypothetical protein